MIAFCVLFRLYFKMFKQRLAILEDQAMVKEDVLGNLLSS